MDRPLCGQETSEYHLTVGRHAIKRLCRISLNWLYFWLVTKWTTFKNEHATSSNRELINWTGEMFQLTSSPAWLSSVFRKTMEVYFSLLPHFSPMTFRDIEWRTYLSKHTHWLMYKHLESSFFFKYFSFMGKIIVWPDNVSPIHYPRLGTTDINSKKAKWIWFSFPYLLNRELMNESPVAGPDSPQMIVSQRSGYLKRLLMVRIPMH